MKLYRFDVGIAKPIQQHDSAGATGLLLAQTLAEAAVACIRLEAGGVLGRHPATQNQLFLVVEGVATVSGDDVESLSIQAGQAAFWQAGEHHETRSTTGLSAIVIEGNDLQPSPLMQLLD